MAAVAGVWLRLAYILAANQEAESSGWKKGQAITPMPFAVLQGSLQTAESAGDQGFKRKSLLGVHHIQTDICLPVFTPFEIMGGAGEMAHQLRVQISAPTSCESQLLVTSGSGALTFSSDPHKPHPYVDT